VDDDTVDAKDFVRDGSKGTPDDPWPGEAIQDAIDYAVRKKKRYVTVGRAVLVEKGIELKGVPTVVLNGEDGE
jgi:hypothetical protein